MNEFEFQKKRMHVNWNRLAAFTVCFCIMLSSVEMKAFAAGIKAAVEQMESWISDGMDRTGYAFVTPDTEDITPDREYEFDACAISRTSFERDMGESVEMKVYAWSKTGDFNYTWYGPSKREIKDVTGDRLMIPELKEESEYGRYRCMVEDEASGQYTSVSFYVRKKTAPLFITTENAYHDMYMGQTDTLSVEAADYGSENQDIDYQWYEGANAIPGANEREYTFTNELPDRSFKKFYCIAGNGKREVKQKINVVSYGAGFKILNDYAVKSGKSGDEITLEVETETFYDSPRFTYQWYKGYILHNNKGIIDDSNAEPIPGENTDSYTFSLSAETEGIYCCIVSDEYGRQVCQQQVKLSDHGTAEEITDRYYVEIEMPDSRTTYPGAKNISIHAKAVSYDSYVLDHDQMTYHWYKGRYKGNGEWEYLTLDEERFAGICTDTLTIRTVLPEDCVNDFICVITCGDSRERGIEALYWRGIRCYGNNDASVSIVTEKGAWRYLRVKPYAPEEACSYQWYHDGKRITGADENTFAVHVEGKEDFGKYSCEVTVNGYTERIETANMYIREEETLKAVAEKSSNSSKTKRVGIGETVDMGAVAYTSAGTLSYQWQVCTASNPQNGTYQFEDIPGETSADYSRKIITNGDYGTYRCKVTCPETDIERYVSYGVYPLKPQTDKIPVAGVTLSQTELKLAKGGQAVLKASVMPSDATDQSVIWSSGNSKIAEVNQGIVKAVEKGTAMITATTVDGRKTAVCTVSVFIPAEQVFLPKNVNLKKGGSCALRATVFPADSTDPIVWTSSNEKAVTVSETGMLSAVGTGTARITAVSESGKRAVCTVKVLNKQVLASKVKIKKAKISMKAGEMKQIQTSVSPKNSTDRLKWTSSNKKTAQVDENGVVTAKRSGKVKITAKTKKGKKAVCEVTITQAAQSIELNKTSLTLKVKKSVRLKAKLTPKGATDKLTWKSSAKKVVSVDKKGKITGLKKGRAVITVKTSGGKTAACVVTVK